MYHTVSRITIVAVEVSAWNVIILMDRLVIFYSGCQDPSSVLNTQSAMEQILGILQGNHEDMLTNT